MQYLYCWLMSKGRLFYDLLSSHGAGKILVSEVLISFYFSVEKRINQSTIFNLSVIKDMKFETCL